MPVITCMICGSTAAQSLDINICTKCIRMGNDGTKILAIEKYLEKYPNATINDLTQFLHIDRIDVDRFIKQGSIKLIPDESKICILQNADDKYKNRDKRREQFIKQIADFPSNSPNTNQIYKNNDTESQLVKDLEEKRNQNKCQEK